MGEINWGGHLILDPKLRSGFFNLPDSSPHFGIGRDGHPDLFKILRQVGKGQEELEKSGFT